MKSNLEFSFTQLTFVIQEPGRLPAYKGSTWHGIVGSRVKRLFCLYPKTECLACNYRPSCGYVDLYEPHLQTHEQATPSSFQKGFVLHGLTDYRKEFRPGDHLTLGLVVIGRMQKYLPVLIEDFRTPFRIGKEPFTISLSEVRQMDFARFREEIIFRDGQLLQAPVQTTSIAHFWKLADVIDTSTVRLDFQTPTRMKSEGRLNKEPDIENIVKALVRKVNSFAVHYGDGQEVIDYEQYKELLETSRSLQVAENTLQWVDWKRYSRRSDETMTLGGFRGSLLLKGQLQPLLPLLMLGEYLHVGKQASFGLGQYTCQFR